MALTQRLQIRQSQALVMTPQLMQAIKLLQLSNLDLAAYVEAELERNPLLERTGDGEGDVAAASAAETRAERDGASAAESGGADWQGENSGEPRAAADEARDSPARPWLRRGRCGAATRRRRDAAGLFRMGRHRLRRPRGRRLQSRGLRLGRDDARRPSRRAARAGDRRSRPPHDRAISDRHGRRGRLPDRRSRGGRRKARRAACRGRGGARRSCRASIRPACARAISPNASRSSSRSATASIRPCRRWSPISICWPSATLRRCASICGVDEEDLADMIARDPPAQSEARPRLRLDAGAADRAGRVRASGTGRRLDRRAQFRHAAQGAGQPELLRRASPRPPRTTATRPIWPIVCRPRPG